MNEKENDDQKLLLKQDLENIFKIWNFQYFRDWKNSISDFILSSDYMSYEEVRWIICNPRK